MSGLCVQSLCSRVVGDGWCLILLLSVGGTWEFPALSTLAARVNQENLPEKYFQRRGI